MKIDFNRGIDGAEYVNGLKFYRSVVRSLIEAAEASPEHAAALRSAAAAVPQPVRASIMTEDWCGDSACNSPILVSLFAAAGVPLTVFRGSDVPELGKYYNDLGVDHIPVVSLWDGTGKEIGRWVEQPVAVAALKDRWKAERPHFMQLYAVKDTDKAAGREFAALYRELVEQMADWYRNGMWNETTREIAGAIATFGATAEA